MNPLLVHFVGCVVLAALCVAGALTAVATGLPEVGAWLVGGVFVFGFLAWLLKEHAEARNG